jgi:xylan 1,4-beta-xylosidase
MPTTLHLDLRKADTYLQNPWAFGGGVSTAANLLRKDVQRALLSCRDDLGFRHVRFHGVFDDAMRIVKPDGSYDFTTIEVAFDWLMEQGFSPYVGLSGVPSGWAGDDGVTPADPEKWVDLCRALAAFVDGRYGCDAQEWHFEVWQQPNRVDRWAANPRDYFRLYDLTARSLKSVNSQLKVGGPAADDAEWTSAFVDHLAEPSTDFGLDMARCDFVAVRSPRASVRAGDLADLLRAVRGRVTEKLGESTPVLLAGWSAAGLDGSPEHDTCAAAARVVSQMAAVAEHCQGCIYDRVSDCDQPADQPIRFEPFHGGAGLLTVNDVKKASFNAMKLWHEHIGYRMDTTTDEPIDGLTIFATKDYHNVVRILAAYDQPGARTAAKFSLSGLPDSVKWGQVQVLRPAAGSPLEAWSEQGRPLFVNRFLLDDLDAGSHPFVTEVNFQEFPPRLETGMVLQLTIPVPDEVAYSD